MCGESNRKSNYRSNATGSPNVRGQISIVLTVVWMTAQGNYPNTAPRADNTESRQLQQTGVETQIWLEVRTPRILIRVRKTEERLGFAKNREFHVQALVRR
jgi:hypothetical protein